MNNQMIRGLANISFYAADLEAAKQWYTEVLGVAPYFQVPGYIEFRIGDYLHELGIIDSRYAPAGATNGPAGSITYWHTDDLKGTMDRLQALGAKEYQPITEHGKGFVTASVIDPFGNPGRDVQPALPGCPERRQGGYGRRLKIDRRKV